MIDFWEALHGSFIYSQRFWKKSSECWSPKKYFHNFITSTPNDRYLRNFFLAGWFTLSGFARNLLLGNRRRYILSPYDEKTKWCLIWDTIPGFTSNKPTHYVLDYDDFKLLTNVSIISTRLFGRTNRIDLNWKEMNISLSWLYFEQKRHWTLKTRLMPSWRYENNAVDRSRWILIVKTMLAIEAKGKVLDKFFLLYKIGSQIIAATVRQMNC